jgi:(p)ppGpp synthase/HD superfamily hydrolase
MDTNELVVKAKSYAFKCHKKVNHWYDGRRYEFHLEMAFKEAIEFIRLVPEELRPYVLAAVWCHDTFEDCRQSYHDIKRNVGDIVADIVYAVSDEKGKTREEKQNEKYYNGIRITTGALYVKLCDRIANVKHSKKTNSHMLKTYKKEWEHFKNQLYNDMYKDMFNKLDSLLNE